MFFPIYVQDKGVIRDLVMTLENYGFQCGNSLENNTYNSSVFQNHSNVQLHVKYLKSNNKLAKRERLFRFSNATFSLSPDALATESGAVIVILWYKTLNSFLGKDLSGDNVYATVNRKVISASVRPEPRMPFRKPIRIIWDTADPVNIHFFSFFSRDFRLRSSLIVVVPVALARRGGSMGASASE